MKKCLEEKKLNPHHAIEEQQKTKIDLNHIQADVVYGEVPIRPKESVEKARGRNASYTAAIATGM